MQRSLLANEATDQSDNQAAHDSWPSRHGVRLRQNPMLAATPALVDVTQDLTDNRADRAGGVDADSTGGQILACQVDPKHELALLGPVAELVNGADVQTPMESLDVYFEDEDLVEQLEERGRVPRPAAEERHRTTLVGNKCPHLVDIPDVVLMAFLKGPAADRFVEK